MRTTARCCGYASIYKLYAYVIDIHLDHIVIVVVDIDSGVVDDYTLFLVVLSSIHAVIADGPCVR